MSRTPNLRQSNVRKLVVTAAIVLAAPMAAQAAGTPAWQQGEAAYTTFPVTPSTLSRAEVKAQVLEARRDGTLSRMQIQQSPAPALVGSERKSREEVVNEMRNEPESERVARSQLMTGA